MAEVRVIIYDSRIEAMSLPGGQVYRWGRQRAQHMRTLARRYAGKRTGLLRATMYSEYIKAPHGAHFFVGTRTGYGVYPHEGTGGQPGGPLFRKRMEGRPGQASKGFWHPGMQHALPGGRWPPVVSGPIRGQRAQKFLTRAMTDVMATL